MPIGRDNILYLNQRKYREYTPVCQAKIILSYSIKEAAELMQIISHFLFVIFDY